MRSRIETLRWLYEEAEDALAIAPADRKSALIGQLRAIAAEIEEVEGAVATPEVQVNPLEQILAKRRSQKAG